MLGIESALLGGLARLGGLTNLGAPGAQFELLVDLLQASLTVLQLAALFSANSHNPCWHMAHPHCRIGSVDALPSRTRRMKGLGLALFGKVVEGESRKARVITVCQLLFAHGTAL